MTLKTLGMGIAKLVTKTAKGVKQGITNPTTNKPFYTAAALALAQKVAREKLKSKKKKKDKE
jgi:hypothetical protein